MAAAATSSWLSDLFTTADGLKGLGSFAGGLGSIYGGIQQANAMKDMNNFTMNAYNDQLAYTKDNDKRRQDAVTNGYGSGLGSYSTPTY